MDERRQFLGRARVREKDGRLYLIWPRALVRCFGLRAGDEVRMRKRRGREQYLISFWRAGRRLEPLLPFPRTQRKSAPLHPKPPLP